MIYDIIFHHNKIRITLSLALPSFRGEFKHQTSSVCVFVAINYIYGPRSISSSLRFPLRSVVELSEGTSDRDRLVEGTEDVDGKSDIDVDSLGIVDVDGALDCDGYSVIKALRDVLG
jgi:hypothetical protein